MKGDSTDNLEVGFKVESGGSESKGNGRDISMKQRGLGELSPFHSSGVAYEIDAVLESALAAEEAVGSGSDGSGFREEGKGREWDAMGVRVERDEEAVLAVGLGEEAGDFVEVNGLLVGEEGRRDPLVPVFRDGFESAQGFGWDETKYVRLYHVLDAHFVL